MTKLCYIREYLYVLLEYVLKFSTPLNFYIYLATDLRRPPPEYIREQAV